MEGRLIYNPHNDFEIPENQNVKIWRYLDFTKYVSLLDKKALFFTRADKLADVFEGSYTKANIELRSRNFKDEPKRMADFVSSSFKKIREFTIVNCWHMNNYESAAMWKLYLKSDEGVAIQSTFKRLKENFNQKKSRPVYIGKVRYIDYEKDVMPQSDALSPYIYKRKSFDHERELRAVSYNVQLNGSSVDSSKVKLNDGDYFPVDLDLLIEQVYVAPIAQEWFYELVKSVTKKYCLNKEIVKSNLTASPLY